MLEWNRHFAAALAVLAFLGLASSAPAQVPPTADQPGVGQEAASLDPLDPGKPSRVEAPDFPPETSQPPAVPEPAGNEGTTTYDPVGALAAPTAQPTRVQAAPDKDRTGDRRPEKTPEKSQPSLQERIVKQANQLVGKHFNYAPGTRGGVMGCANVVSSILRAAGVVKSIMISCRQVIADLLRRGWEQVKAPPYQDGDVLTWATYDRTGDGRVDPDTHIGIIDKQGGTTYAINNSSSRRYPVKVELGAMHYPISRVLRRKK